jgi:membrane-associated phospholipid phosphatase
VTIDGRRTLGDAVGFIREVALVTALMLCYVSGRRLVEGEATAAFANAATIIEWERALGIDVEPTLHRFVASRDVLAAMSATVYLWTNWVTIVVGMLVVRRRDADRYRALRTGLAISAAVGLVCAWLVPVAPPRLLDGYDDIVYGAWDDVTSRPPGGSNVFAAFPSFHVGWPAVVGASVAVTFRHPTHRRPARWLALAPAAVLAVVVVTTANHFVVDVIGGVVIAWGCDAVARRAYRPIGPVRSTIRTAR